jgi:sortase B
MEWEIVGVYVVDSSYNYVITMDFEDDAAYREFLDDITERTIYPLREPLTLEDKILTMVTCSYEFDGARTIIQAKLVNADPTPNDQAH